MTEEDVYQFYNDYVKVLYSEIEARNNSLPVELLFEIHSAFDHLKRIHIDNEDSEICAEKAYSHLKRGVLDAFKLKLKYFNKDYERFFKKKTDFRIIDNGTFLPQMIQARKEIEKHAKSARLNEGKLDFESSFNEWCVVSDLINQFEENYFLSKAVTWAAKQSFFRFAVSFLVGVVTGLIASGIFEIIKRICLKKF